MALRKWSICKVRKNYFEILYLTKRCRAALCNSQISVAVQGKDQQKGFDCVQKGTSRMKMHKNGRMKIATFAKAEEMMRK